MKKGLIVLIVFVVVALMLGNSFISRRNQMAVKREAVNAAWAQVDVVLQRRADLIPNLVETVKGFAAQEQTVFGDIAKARSALLGAHSPAEKITANGQSHRRGAPPLQRGSAGLQHIYCALPEQLGSEPEQLHA